jgi:hypothetical protein
MKKKVKKLNLNRETLHALETPELKEVGGLLTTDPCLTNRRSCIGSQGTCCTQYC